MAVITLGASSGQAGSSVSVTLNKSELVELVSDPYYEDQSVWNKIYAIMSSDGQEEQIDVTSGSGTFQTSTVAQRGTWTLTAINIIDYDGGVDRTSRGLSGITYTIIGPDQPTISSPTNGATGVTVPFSITTSAYNVTGETNDTHVQSDYVVKDVSGTTIFSSRNDASNLETISVTTGSFATSTTYYARARHEGGTYGNSPWSDSVSFTTASLFLAELWSAVSSMIGAKRGPAGLGSKDSALSISGYTTGVALNVQAFDGSSWSYGTSVSSPKYLAGSFGTFGSGLFFCGFNDLGSTKTDSSEVWNGTSWSTGASTASTSGPSSGCGVLSSGLAVNIGGNSYIYNGSTWGSSASLTTSTQDGVLFGTSGSALHCGDDATSVSTVDSWNGTSWSAGTSTNSNKRYSSANGTTTKGMTYGFNAGSANVTEIWNGTSWSAGDSLNTARGEMSHCGSYAAAFCCGGYTGSLSDVAEIYT